MPIPLEGLHVRLTIADPWDLVDPDGSNQFLAAILRASTYQEGADEERVLLQLAGPVNWQEHEVLSLFAANATAMGLGKIWCAGSLSNAASLRSLRNVQGRMILLIPAGGEVVWPPGAPYKS